MSLSRQWIVAQVGRREHYLAARAFQRKQCLRSLYTDVWCQYGRTLLSRCRGPLEAIAWRYHPDIPSRKVFSFPLSFAPLALRRSLTNFSTNTEVRQHHLRVGRWFGNTVRRQLERQSVSPDCDSFFGFSQDSLEVLEYLHEKRVFTILDQIDPAQLEEGLLLKEYEKWPGWERFPGRIPEEFWDRLKREWRLASLVLVNSHFSKRALTQAGVPEGKIVVVPLAYEPPTGLPTKLFATRGPLTVLWLGQVGLRKGIQYLIQSAEILKDYDIRFLVAGATRISAEALSSVPANMTFLGYVDRSAVSQCYATSDVFVLPTLADGFAITQLEAMAYGLPVIATPNCGDVVREGLDGFLVEPGDPVGLANSILSFAQDRNLLEAMSRRVIERSKEFSIDLYGDEIQKGVAKALTSPRAHDLTSHPNSGER